MKAKLLLLTLLLGLNCCLSGCKEKILKPAMLDGYWQLIKATREGQPTTTLENSWIEFSQSTARTNLPLGLGETITYSTKEDMLIFKGTGEQIFQVKAMTDSALQLAFETRGFEFVLDLQKGPKPEEEPDPAQPVEQ